MREDDVIELIKKRLKNSRRDVIIGPGDDTAVLRYDKKHYLLLTTDCVVENIHFKRPSASFFQIGRKAMAVNLSDIASMGGLPLYALVSAGLPAGLPVKAIKQLVDGMQSMADAYNFDIVGGNLSRSPVLFIDVSLAGRVEKKHLKLRSGAKPGDAVFVTGKLGGTLAGKHLNIMPRIKESRKIIRKVRVNAMMDISDGLSSDLTRLVNASGAGFKIFLDRIPVSADAVRMSRTVKDAIHHALNDGEDYELLFTVPAAYKNKVPERAGSLHVTCIGEITKEKKYTGVYNTGKIVSIRPSGYSHF
ncbi:MAG: thiamine-monophosphate kinase [Candidatus Omnitrophica bacterium]|nr:thiamine-monophosphate kinase [Candidatus Omnitrophota bacterium]